MVVISPLCFAGGGNVVKALFRYGYAPQVLSQLRRVIIAGIIAVQLGRRESPLPAPMLE